MSLISKYSDVVSYVLALKKVDFEDCDMADVQTKLYKGLDEAKKEVLQTYSNEDYLDSLFAICAWIDEIMLCSTWADKDQWSKVLLQYSFFNTTKAGEDFFVKLEEISPNNTEMLEVYLYCLKLGFRGKYYSVNDIPVINDRTKHLYKLVMDKYQEDSRKPLSSNVLSPRLNQEIGAVKGETVEKRFSLKNRWVWVFPVVPVVVISLLLNEIVKSYFA